MNASNLPIVIDITLHKYNHLDNRLWVQIKNDLNYIDVDGDSVLVDVDELRNLIEVNYASMINTVKSVGSDFLHKKVNSIYFIYGILIDFSNLKFIKVTKSCDKKFTRLLEIEGDKMLKFDFKVLSMTLRLHDWFYTEELKILNPILEELKILEEGIPYNRIKLIDLVDSLEGWLDREMSEQISETAKHDPVPLVTELIELIDPKIERDNPLLLLITDH
jgi:hypothetical protein